MEIQTIAIDKVKPAAYNPRKDLKPGDPEYEKLKKSIAEFDIVEPLIWNKRSGNLVGGHQRLKVLRERGDATVEVSIVDLDDAKEKALNIALNKISGEWDYPVLMGLLKELDAGDLNMEITGFDYKEFEDLMNQFYEPEEGLTNDDEVPEAVETVCKAGDLWVLGNHRLLCGDATVEAHVAKLMAGDKADMVFTDPPYGMDLDTDYSGIKSSMRAIGHNKVGGNKWRKVVGDNEDFDPSFLLQYFIQVKEQFWFGADYYVERITNKNDGSWLVWDKRKESQSEAIGSEFELIWSKSKHKRRVLRHDWFGFLSSQNTKEAQKRLHPTQKPTSLIVDIIKQWCKGDLIIDPFGGSGSTLIACEKLGRRCYMMEIDQHYCDVIIQRWQNFTGKEAIKIDERARESKTTVAAAG